MSARLYPHNLFATASYQDGDMRLLDSLGLIDRTAHLVIVPLEGCLFLRPHGKGHPYRLVESTQTLSSLGKVVALTVIFVLVPTCPDAKGESPV